MKASRLVYPPPLYGRLRPAIAAVDLRKIEDYRTFVKTARRIPYSFSGSITLVIKITSRIAYQNNWLAAGCIAQSAEDLPGHPKQLVKRVYIDSAVFQFETLSDSYYFEFWPYQWITDYRLEVWAKIQDNVLP